MLKLNATVLKELSRRDLPRTLIARVTKNPNYPRALRERTVFLYAGQVDTMPMGFAATLYQDEKYSLVCDGPNHFVIGKQLDFLNDGDIIKINSDLKIRVMYRKGGTNSLLVTERCNSFCVMCSQPPRDIDDSYLVHDLIAAIQLMPPDTPELGITGGGADAAGRSIVRATAYNQKQFAANSCAHTEQRQKLQRHRSCAAYGKACATRCHAGHSVI